MMKLALTVLSLCIGTAIYALLTDKSIEDVLPNMYFLSAGACIGWITGNID